MKVFVFVLLLANLLFAAFAGGYFGRPDNPDAGRVDQQITPERMRIVARGEAPETPAKAEASVEPPPKPVVEQIVPTEPSAPAEPAAAEAPRGNAEGSGNESAGEAAAEMTCLVWRNLPMADADRLAALLARRFADYKLSQQKNVAESHGWWVSIPPLAGKPEADKKAGELLELGVKDYFVIQDGASRFGISLGVFSNEKGARDRLAELKTKGVRSAVAAPRPGKDDTATLQVRGSVQKRAEVIGAAGRLLPKSEPQACP